MPPGAGIGVSRRRWALPTTLLFSISIVFLFSCSVFCFFTRVNWKVGGRQSRQRLRRRRGLFVTLLPVVLSFQLVFLLAKSREDTLTAAKLGSLVSKPVVPLSVRRQAFQRYTELRFQLTNSTSSYQGKLEPHKPLRAAPLHQTDDRSRSITSSVLSFVDFETASTGFHGDNLHRDLCLCFFHEICYRGSRTETTHIYLTGGAISVEPIPYQSSTARILEGISLECHLTASHQNFKSISKQSDSLTHSLVARTTVQECRRARFDRYYVTAALLSHYAVSSIDGSSQSQLCDFQTGVGARRSNLPKAFYLLSDVRSHMFNLNECDDCMFRSPSGITYWSRHGNVEFRVLNPSKPSSLSSIFILCTFLEVKLELEIHLVSSVSRVGLKAESFCFSAKSSLLGLLTLIVVYGSRASHLKLWSDNNTRCINVVLDYQLFLGTIAMGPKVELLFGFLHFAEHDSPLDGFIPSCFVMSFSFFRPSSMAPDSPASVVIDVAL